MDNESYADELRDDSFWRYVMDPTNPDPKHPIEQSAVHHQQAQALIQLRSLLYRTTCPTAHELGEYYLGDLARPQRQAIQQHLARCPHCVRELVMYRKIMGEPEPSPSRLEQFKIVMTQLWDSMMGTGETWQPALATRGEMQGGPAVYVTDEGIRIAIRKQEDIAHPGYKLLAGLISGVTTDSLQVHLWSADLYLAVTAVDSLGNFFFDRLEPKSYELVIQGENLLIHIQTLQI